MIIYQILDLFLLCYLNRIPYHLGLALKNNYRIILPSITLHQMLFLIDATFKKSYKTGFEALLSCFRLHGKELHLAGFETTALGLNKSRISYGDLKCPILFLI